MELQVWWVLMHRIIILLALTSTILVAAAGVGGGGGGGGSCNNNNNIDDTDRLSLLSFKSQITKDPHGILNSWNESLHLCEWTGITCGRRHKRVTKLELNSYDLNGIISSHVGNLSFLRTLDLRNNTFTHQIPPQIGRLFRLTELLLSNNSLTGPIPHNISRCFALQYLDLALNNLTGKVVIPAELGLFSKLKVIDLGDNQFDGEIPESIGNLSLLERLRLSENNLHGHIPTSFGLLKSLKAFQLFENDLSGAIPHSMFINLSSIRVFAVTSNRLQGSLPPDLAHNLPNLQKFLFSDNQFGGPIPNSFSNASNLVYFEVALNNFTGKVPSFSRSSNLQSLYLQVNNLGSLEEDEDEDLNFLSSLTNCTHLRVLVMSFNNFQLTLHKSIGNLSTELQKFVIGENWIHGSIPNEIGNLINLELLGIEQNQLTGPIPSSIGKLQKLNLIYLNNNKLSGVVPSSLGNLTRLSRLYLGSNTLQGSVPSSLGECKSLTLMDLSKNNLSGPIPKQLIELSSLSITLDLSSNSLIGLIPTEVGKLVNLQDLDLDDNKLTGEIPATLGGCTSLMYLHLHGNSLHGNIPLSLASLRGIEEIDLSSNNLSGTVPAYLQTFHFLNILNLSFNDFEGEVPIRGVFSNATALSMVGNTRLCGGIPQLNLSKCSSIPYMKHKLSRKVKITIVSVACGLVALILVMCSVLFCVLSKRRKASNLGFTCTFGIPQLKVSYGDLFKATDGFSESNLIGDGSFGSVYKGILNQPETQVIAVKVLKLETSRASKSFIAECKALKRIKHRNLVRIITACSSIDFQGNDFKALIYEFMVNGSLEEWLHPTHSANLEEHKHLSLIDRVNISLHVANALDYLHNQCHVPIVHCDLKPSNVLLDSDMNAHLGDFGLVRFLPNASHPFSSEQTSSLGIRGSIGYIAPVWHGKRGSKSGDVYSYGILLLEMFTGKRPTDIMFRDGLNLHNFALAGLSNSVEEIVDARLLQTEDESSSNTARNRNNMAQNQCRTHDCLISVIKIGVACSARQQRERMDIAKVVSELCHIKERLVGT